MDLMLTSTILWFVGAFFVAMLLLACLLWAKMNYYIVSISNELRAQSAEAAAHIPPMAYTTQIVNPVTNGIYQRDIAYNLACTCYATSHAVESGLTNIDHPIGYPNYTPIISINPIDNTNTTYGYIFWNDTSVIFSFSGTSSKSEWTSDFQYTLVPAVKLNGYEPGVLCHQGFYDIYVSFQNVLWDWLNTHLYITNIFITGISLGGALSNLCAYDFAKSRPHIIHYSFASPQSGNPTFAKQFNSRLPTSLRVYNTSDVIPDLPPSVISGYVYSHVGQNVPFTYSGPSLAYNHIATYAEYLPHCPQFTDCHQ